MFVGSLPNDATEDSVKALFAEFGTVRSIHIISDIFTGRCKGFGHVEMEGHEARAAIAGLDGKTFGGKSIKVRFEDDRYSKKRRR